MPEEYNYNKDLSIDLNALEEEWQMQPQLYMKYSVLATQAQETLDRAKENIDVVKAELDAQIREDPGSYGNCPSTKDGVLKPTESWVSGTVILQGAYKKAMEDFHRAKLQLGYLQSAVRAFDHRSNALKNEVSLYLGGYYSVSNPEKLVTGARRILEAVEEKATEKQRTALNQTPRRPQRRMPPQG